jgi:hypothetical protein
MKNLKDGGVPAEILTEANPNTSRKLYRYTKLFGGKD